jgi:hypothetical protein
MPSHCRKTCASAWEEDDLFADTLDKRIAVKNDKLLKRFL